MAAAVFVGYSLDSVGRSCYKHWKVPIAFGQFVLVELLGKGAMGEVWLARPAQGGSRRVVVKRILPELSNDPDFLRRFEHEAVIASHIHSPFVARLLEAGQVGPELYLVHEFVEGWPLGRVLGELRKDGKAPSIESALELILGILSGLESIHSARDQRGPLGVVHRDLSPNNVIVGVDGKPKIIDLGLGKSHLQTWKTQTGAVMGSPGYMSPEQALGKQVDRRSDVYSAGALAFEILTLKPMIERGPIASMLQRTAESARHSCVSVRHDVPSSIDEAVVRATAFDPGDRFASALQFAEALTRGRRRPRRRPEVLLSLVGPALSSDAVETYLEWTRVTGGPDAESTQLPTRVITRVEAPWSRRLLWKGALVITATVFAAVLIWSRDPNGPRGGRGSTPPMLVGSQTTVPAEAGPSVRKAKSSSAVNGVLEVAEGLLESASVAKTAAERRRFLEMCVKLEVLPECQIRLDSMASSRAPQPSSNPNGSVRAAPTRTHEPRDASPKLEVEEDLATQQKRLNELLVRVRSLSSPNPAKAALKSAIVSEMSSPDPSRIADLTRQVQELEAEE